MAFYLFSLCPPVLQGVAGEPGLKGEKGDEGRTGPSGQVGFPGLKGETGAKVSITYVGPYTVQEIQTDGVVSTEAIFVYTLYYILLCLV